MAAALATTVQRPGGGRAPRYSFAASGANQGLLDLEGWAPAACWMLLHCLGASLARAL